MRARASSLFVGDCGRDSWRAKENSFLGDVVSDVGVSDFSRVSGQDLASYFEGTWPPRLAAVTIAQSEVSSEFFLLPA